MVRPTGDDGAQAPPYSVQAVLLVSHRRRQVTVIERTRTGWLEREARAGESVALTNPELVFAIDELYFGVDLDGGSQAR